MFTRFRLTLGALVLMALPAHAFDTAATSAWVYDVGTQTVLMDKNANIPLPPASMSKLMTLNMLFEALQDGRVTMDTTFAVSSKAKSMEGSTMFLNEQDRPTVRELIHGIIINSGNDACVVVAEGLAGSEEAFARQMTDRAQALGMTNSTFANASGWPDPNQRMSMHDLGIVALRIIQQFPEEYAVFSQTEFDYKDRSPANRFNRNPLLKLNIGADGLKTGHTTEAGYGLVGSVVQGDRRIVLVISGLTSDTARSQEAEKIVNWAFRQFVEKTVAHKGQRIAAANVWMGDAPTVGLVPEKDISLLVPSQVQEAVTAEVSYNGPLVAPIPAGTQVADLVIHIPDLPDARIPLVTEAEVGKAGFMTRLTTAASVLIQRYMDQAPAS